MRRLTGRALDPPAESGPAAEDGRTGLPPRAKPGVLVVDDEHLVRVIMQLGLERDGFEVWTAANGRQAIELYREHREDIAAVLLDVRMPGLDGPATLGALRATGYGPLRVIEVTVHARVVILEGRAPSYYLKQVAQATALAVAGARQARNDLDVGRPS